jgi:RNA polymerase sigma factor (sigma-70 family)
MNTLELSNRLVRMKDNMERFAFSLTLNREDANDLLQETYLRALSNMDYVVEFTNLKAWAFTIMKNIFINNYRKSVREKTVFDNTEELIMVNGALNESGLVMPDTELAYKEINSDIDTLSDEFKIPFRMHIEGFKYQEIADDLNLKIGTVKSRIFFARKKLMESLQEYK